YLVMAAIGTTALLFAFGGLAGTAGGYAFDAIRAQTPQPMVAALILAAALVGCGSKGGLVPLHAWLPLAHPAAPSHVSALMSGVMTKVAIYGFVRIAFDLLGPPAWWWSLPPIVLGAITAVLGLLYAVFDRDLKRVLAYSTVENVGVIFVALGLALAFRANGQPAAAAVAMAAALLHILNHSWFKSLLFLGAGAVLHVTGGGALHLRPAAAQRIRIRVAAVPVGHRRARLATVGVELRRTRHRGDAGLGGGVALLCILGGLLGALLTGALAPVLKGLVGSELPNAGTGPTPFSLIAFDA